MLKSSRIQVPPQWFSQNRVSVSKELEIAPTVSDDARQRSR